MTLVPQVLPLKSDPSATACLDTGCGVIFVDKNWLLRQIPNQKIKEMSIPLKIRGIGASKHKSAQFAELSLFLLGENDKEQKVYASFKYELHLVEGLRAKMLIGNNILALENLVLNIGLGHSIVGSCGVKITIKATQRGQFLRRKLLAENNEVVPPCFEAIIPILPVPVPDNRNFLFHLAAQTNLTLFAHIIDHETSKVLVRNTSNRPLRVSRRQKLGHIVNIRYDNCFLADADSAFQSATVPSRIQPLFEQEPSLAPNPTEYSMETKLHNGVRVYGDPHAVAQLAQLVADYSSIWESECFV